MRSLRFTLLIILFGFFANICNIYGQAGAAPAVTGKVAGKIVDDKNQPVSYATVTLMRADSSVVNGDLSKDDGTFSISPTGLGHFVLRIESIGVATKFIAVNVTTDSNQKDLGSVRLVQTQKSLNEVSVVGEKPVVEMKVDKKVFNVEKNITTAGGSATDVLQNVPSVSVDADGNVSLRGNSNVTILIDGKPSTLLGSDVTSALQSLPAGSIESVEVITNPSAKYDAQGTTGIINIVLKHDAKLGINGSATLGAGTNDKYNGNLSLNVRKGKWNAFLNSSFRLNSSWNDVTTDRTDKKPDSATGITHSYHTFEHVPRHFDGNFNTIGVSYDPDKFNSFTLTENVNIMHFGFKDYSNYNVYSNSNETGSSIFHDNRYSEFAGGPVSSSSALDYRKKFKKKDEELSVDATYAYTTIKKTNTYKTYLDSNGVSLPYSPISETSPGSGNNTTVNVWADYTDPLFTANGKLGLGFKSQFYWFNSSGVPLVDSTGRQQVVDQTLVSDYSYKQQIHAGYVNWNDQIGKFSYQAGVRLEDAEYDGSGYVPTYATFHNSFLNLFPSAFVSYQLPNQQSIYLNYSRRTNRPGFMQLLPFKDFSNPGTVNMGNPGLVPEFINNIEFAYSKSDNKGNNIIVSTYYTYTENLTERITRPITAADSVNGLNPAMGLLSTPLNIAHGQTYGLEGTGHFQILPIWDATLNANFFENKLTVGNNNIYGIPDNSGFTWFGKVNTSVKLPKGFTLQVNANYESPKVVAQGTLSDTWWMDVAVRKNFFKNKATLVLNCSDIFNTHRFITNYNTDYYVETINRVKETRVGNITFTYRFGKTDIGSKQGAGKKSKQPDDKLKPEKPNEEDRDKNMKEGDDDNGGGGMGGGGGQGGPGGGQKGGGGTK